MSKDIRITVVPYSEIQENEDFRPPSSFYFVSAVGDWIFVHVRARADAIKYVKDEWGGKYDVRASRLQKGNGNITCKGTQTIVKKL